MEIQRSGLRVNGLGSVTGDTVLVRGNLQGSGSMEARAAKKQREITEEDLLRITLLVMLWRLTKKFAFFGFRLIDEGFENECVINPRMLR